MLKETLYFSTLRKAMRLALYVAVMTMATNNQQLMNIVPDVANGFINLPYKCKSIHANKLCILLKCIEVYKGFHTSV